MKFDLTKSNGIYGLWFMGFSVPLWVAFFFLNLLANEPVISLVIALLGSGAFIAGVVLLFMNTKESEGSNFPQSSTVQALYLVSLAINLVCIVLGNIFML